MAIMTLRKHVRMLLRRGKRPIHGYRIGNSECKMLWFALTEDSYGGGMVVWPPRYLSGYELPFNLG